MIYAVSQPSFYYIVNRWWAAHGWPVGVWSWLWMLILAVVVLIFLLLTVMLLIWMERKVAGDIQSRIGPLRVGKFGLLQSVADALKLLTKEDLIPAAADRWVFILAPIVVFIPTLLVYIVLPFGTDWTLARDLNVGILFIVAVSAVPIIGLLMAGWGSNNKWSLLGGLRAAAQLISYEVPLVLTLLTVVAVSNTLNTHDLVMGQQDGHWLLWRCPPLMIISFVIFLIAGMAEINRVPFDIPEAESELVAGFHTEYSGMRFAFFFLGEFAHMFFLAGLGAALFLGGGDGWSFGPWWLRELLPFCWFLLKAYVLVWLMMWLRWTLPRLRVDQLMQFAWKLLLPAALVDLLLIALWVAH